MKRSKTTPNRKALPKFLKWLLISAVFGFCVGIASGILDDLENAGIQEGDTVRMYGFEFDYYK